MGNYKRLGKNIILQTIGKFSSKLLVFFLVPFYTSVMTTEEYGIADYVNVMINLLYPILTLIIVEAEVRFTLDSEENKKQVFTFSNIVGIGGIIIALAIAPLLSINTIIKEWYWLFLLGLVSWIVYEIFMHFSFGLDKVGTAASAGAINTFSTIITTIVALLFFKAGIMGYLVANAIGNFVGAIYIFLKEKLYSFYVIPCQIDRTLPKRMLKYSVPLVPNSISWWINNSADKYLIQFFHGASTMALLSVAYKIPSILVIIVSIFSAAWHISSVEHFGTEENIIFFKNIYKIFNLVLSISTALCLLSTQEISRFLFKSDFFEAWNIVPVLLVAYLFQGEATFLGSVFTANKNTNVVFVSTLFGAVVNVGLNLILIPQFSNMGAAIATLSGNFVICLIRQILSKRYIYLGFKFLDEGFSILVLVIIAVSAYFSALTRLIVGTIGILMIAFIQRNTMVFLWKNIKRTTKK